VTDDTNQCKEHKWLSECLKVMKIEIRGMVQWKHLVIFGIIVITFGLMLIQSNAKDIEINKCDIKKLESIYQDVKAIKAAVVKE